jgi:hypothetical protein
MSAGGRVFRAALVVLVAASASARADGRDTAELFPADTLAFAEIARPAATADALAALLKHTPFADTLGFTHDRLDKAPQGDRMPGIHAAARVGLLASPEVLAELRKVRGAAVGLTGFTAKGQPKFAAAVLIPDSPLLGLLARAFLTTTPNLRRVATADGVPVFQFRSFIGPLNDPATGQPLGKDDEDNPLRDHKLMPGFGEPTFAYTPGLFVAGSDAEAVADVLTRFAGKAKTPSMAAGPAKPGVRFRVVPPALFAALEPARKAGVGEPESVAWLRFLLPPKAVRSVAGNLELGPDGVGLVADVGREPGLACPLLDVLAGPAVPPTWPRAKSPAWSVSLSLSPAEGRATAVLAVADAVAKASGAVGGLPSERAKAADGFDLPGLLRTAAGVTVYCHPGSGGLAVVVHTDTEVAATAWADAVPKLVRFAVEADAIPAPVAETVGGVRVASIAADGLPGGRVCYAKAGKSLVFVADPKAAAAFVQTATPVTGGPPDAVAVGVLHPGIVTSAAFPEKPAVKAAGVGPAFRPLELPVPGGPVQPAPSFVGLAKAAGHLPPVTLTVTRTPAGLRLEVWHRDLAKPLGKAAGEAWQWLERRPVADDGTPGLLPPLDINSFRGPFAPPPPE